MRNENHGLTIVKGPIGLLFNPPGGLGETSEGVLQSRFEPSGDFALRPVFLLPRCIQSVDESLGFRALNGRVEIVRELPDSRTETYSVRIDLFTCRNKNSSPV